MYCVYVCVCMYVHVCMYVCVYVCMCMRVCTRVCVCMYMCCIFSQSVDIVSRLHLESFPSVQMVRFNVLNYLRKTIYY